ncbi:hypothetical protein JI735_19435 [Paenibacillus sonchi]|uniref:Uncharacterized protein n=1 Tax=Paenibacillus sonchi TaxID=373687 RepID=A0A974P890_9BACL|nr:hypothetical protein [Paenibacillus sonchi]QQZ58906.1 hypothetical protein JI735_19435 [Paenibacillus sonchi]
MRFIRSYNRIMDRKNSINNKNSAKIKRISKNRFRRTSTNLPTIDEGEYLAGKILEKPLESYVEGLKLAFDLLIETLTIAPAQDYRELRSSFLVSNSLLIKCINDLRALWQLGSKGYPIQAATIASSLYETSFTIGAIGDDDEAADNWINHSDFTSMPMSVFKMTKDTIKKQTQNIDIPFKSLAEAEYKKYQTLCMAKHGNPLIQMRHGITLQNGAFIGEPGPENTEDSLKLICYSMESSISFVMAGVATYINEHLVDLNTTKLVEKYNNVLEFYKLLVQQSINKWGSDNS